MRRRITLGPPPPGPRLPRRLQSLAFGFAPVRFVDACRRRYGDVVGFSTVFNPRFVMVFEPDLVREVLGAPPQRLRAGEAQAPLSPVVGERSVLVLDGEEHQFVRRLLSPPLHGERMRAHARIVREAADRAIDSWPIGRPFALLASMRALTLEVAIRVALGVGPGERAAELGTRIRAMLDPHRPRRVRVARPVTSVAARRAVDELVREEIARRRRAEDLQERDDVLSLLLLAGGEAVADQELCDDLVTLLIAGHETTAVALAWAFELLLRHPAAFERLEAELADDGEEYLEAVVNETLRLRPPVAHLVRVVHGQAWQLGRYRIPPGTELRASVAAGQRAGDRRPDSLAFRPERFLGRDRPDNGASVPFGGGARRCPGASFATFEMAIVIRRMLERARLVPAGRRPEKSVLGGRMQAPARGVRVKRVDSAAIPGSPLAILGQWSRLSRWPEWAQSKLAFMAAVTVLLSPAISALRLVEILTTIIAGAAFGYGLNDVADRACDARAGKANRASGVAGLVWKGFLTLTGAGALGLSLAWAPDLAAPALVVASLGLAVAYSVAPVRLKERGAAGIVAAAGAQWAVPVLVVSAAEPRGWLRPAAWSLAALGLAIGVRWMAVHQARDASRDRLAGVWTYGSRGGGIGRLLAGAFACELLFLAVGLASTWPRSLPAALALALGLAADALPLSRRRPLRARLAGYEGAPLAGFYFFAFPAALAVSRLVAAPGSGSAAVAAVLMAVCLPHPLGAIRSWRASPPSASSDAKRASASTQSPVVSASDPHP